MIFLAVAGYKGLPQRDYAQAMFCLCTFIVFGFLLRNIWLSLFVLWTVTLYIMFGLETGVVYITNMFFGCVLYYATKQVYQKKHIDFYIKILLIFTGCNLVYMGLQILDFDFYYLMVIRNLQGVLSTVNNTDPCGFMGYKAGMGMLMAMSIPLVATRRFRFALVTSLLLFVPIYISRSSICIVGGIVGYMTVLWFRISRRHWWSLVVIMGLLASLYVIKIDAPMGTLNTRPKQWKTVLRDCTEHPIKGWGLDSFRHFTKLKKTNYCDSITKTIKDGKSSVHLVQWDNPHNLPISIFFEWGLIGLLLLGGYIRACFIRFKGALKSPNTLALTGFMIVFFIVSLAQFPIFLGKFAVFVIPLFALYEISVGD